MNGVALKVEGMHCEGCAKTIEALLGVEPGVQRALDVLAHYWAGSFPKWMGAVLILLGAWSIYFGLFVEVPLA